MYPDHNYMLLDKPFARFGEAYLVVSPTDIMFTTNNAEAIHQITQRREHFPKNVALYSILAQFGANLLTTEGAIWKAHRKATSASFNEKNAALVFIEAIRQARSMCEKWMAGDENTSKTITTVDQDTMRFALNIIGYVGFGMRLIWPGQELPADLDASARKYGSLEPAEGHTMSFTDSVAILLERILALLLLPTWLLSKTPVSFILYVPRPLY